MTGDLRIGRMGPPETTSIARSHELAPGEVAETPERFDPVSMRGELIEAEHLARYRFAAEFAAQRRVLDAACGWGYGSNILARAGAESVVGVDHAESVVEVARANAEENVSLQVADVVNLPFEDDSFGLVVCLEVIEQVSDWSRALDELRRVLAPDGVLVVSTPNLPAYGDRNPHHVHQIARDELGTELSRRFAKVAMFAQQAWITSSVMTAEVAAAERVEIESAHVLKTCGLPEQGETYLVAVASDAPVATPAPSSVMADSADLKGWLERWEAQDRYLRELRSELDALRLDNVDAVRTRLVENAQTLADLERQNAQLEQELDVLKSSFSWRVTQPLRRFGLFRRIARRSRG